MPRRAGAGRWRWSSPSRRSSNGTGRGAIAVLERLLGGFGGHVDARAAGRQTGRHRLDDAGVRRRLPRAGAPLAADAVTLSPYLGFGRSLRRRAAVDRARSVRAGPDVNAEGAAVQAAVTAGARWRSPSSTRRRPATAGVPPLGDVGLVVGPPPTTGSTWRAERPDARPRDRRAGRGARRHRRPFPRRRWPRSAVGEPLGPRGGPDVRSASAAAAERCVDELPAAQFDAAPAPADRRLRARGPNYVEPLVAARGPIGERSVTVCWPPVTGRLRGVVVEVRRRPSCGRHPPVGSLAGASVRALGA